MKHPHFKSAAIACLSAIALVAAAYAATPARTKARPDSRFRIGELSPRAALLGKRQAVLTNKISDRNFDAVRNTLDFKSRSAAKAPVMPEGLCGSVIMGYSEDTPLGMYKFDSTGKGTLLAEDVEASYGGFAANGNYYLNNEISAYGGSYLYHEVYSISNWEQTYRQAFYDENEVANDMAYDPLTGRGYGFFYTTDMQPVFGWIDLNTFEVVNVGKPVDYTVSGIAISNEGIIYAIDVTGMLSTVDRYTGEMTPVGDTGLKTAYATSAVYDEANKRILYGLQTDYDAALYAIDPATGQSTWLYDFDQSYQVTGMWFDNAPETGAVPAAAADLTLTPEGGTLNATVEMTVPATDTKGEALTGDLNYTIKLDGKEVKSGVSAAGSKISETLTVENAGRHDITVVFVSDKGQGIPASASAIFGTGAPQAPANLKAEFDDATSAVTLTWDPVGATAINGGFVDPEKTLYNVVRMPDAKVIAEKTDKLTASDVLTVPTDKLLTYTYEVTPVYDNLVGTSATSNAITVGANGTPYTEGFDSADAIKAFTIIDGESAYTPNTWKYQSGAANGRCGAWLITPAIYLESGKTYNFSCNVKGQYAFYDESLEAYLGTAPQPEALTTELFKTGTFRSGSYKSYGSAISVETSGLYYIGFHNVSPSFSMSIYVDDIKVSSGFYAQTPLACTDMKVSPYADGSGNAVIFVKAPAKTAGGTNLSKISKVEIFRDDKLVKTFTAAKPGQIFTVTDTNVEPGEHTWTAIAWSGDYEGFPASATAFVGINLPVNVTGAKVEKTEKPGEVKITWNPVTVDIAGAELLPENVTYAVSDGNAVIATTSLNEYTYQAVPENEQNYVQYGVFAVTKAGASKSAAVTSVILVGNPAALPWSESVSGGKLENSYIIADGSSRYAQWGVLTPETVGYPDADGNGGMLALVSRYKYEKSTLVGPSVAIGDAENPVFSLQYYVPEIGTKNELAAYVKDSDDPDAKLTQVGETLKYPEAEPGWHTAIFDLSDYKGKNITVAIWINIVSHVTTMIDNIRVYDRPEKNLRALALSVPAEVTPGEVAKFNAIVENNGSQDMGAFKIELLDGDKVVATKDAEGIAAGQQGVIPFELTYGVTDNLKQSLKARISSTEDTDATDNETPEASFSIRLPEYPLVSEFTGEGNGEDAILTWAKPQLAGENEPVTADFETSTAWTTDHAAGWTFVDVDGLPSGGIEGVDMPGITNNIVPFFVLNCDDERFGSSLKAHSGSMCLGSMFVVSETSVRSADWMISPELNGKAQTVTLWARSFAAKYPEKFDFMVSTTGTEIKDFKRIGENRQIPAEWTEYSIDLPEGSKYLAIRCSSEDAFMLLIDDITYTPLYSPMEIKNYRLYADRKMIYEGSDLTYTHTGEAKAEHTYFVTAVYDRGESAPSPEVKIEYSGIGTFGAGQASITTVDGAIIFSGLNGVQATIVTADGRIVSDTVLVGDVVSVKCAPGIYLVSAAGKTAKLLVR